MSETATDYPDKKPDGWVYIDGTDRNNPDEVRSHVYCGRAYHTLHGPLCGYGWNRSDGMVFSIFRGHISQRGECITCKRRMREGAGPVKPWAHKTKWI